MNRRGFLSLSTLALGGLGKRHRVPAPRRLGAVLEPPGPPSEAIDVCCPQAYVSVIKNGVARCANQPAARTKTGVELMFSNIRYSPRFFEAGEDETE